MFTIEREIVPQASRTRRFNHPFSIFTLHHKVLYTPQHSARSIKSFSDFMWSEGLGASAAQTISQTKVARRASKNLTAVMLIANLLAGDERGISQAHWQSSTAHTEGAVKDVFTK